MFAQCTSVMLEYYQEDIVTIDELEKAALKLDSKSRARLAERLLASLQNLSDAENAQLWAEEAKRRDQELDVDGTTGRPAVNVLREIMSGINERLRLIKGSVI